VQAFAAHPRNLHALVVERHGRLVAESYRSGQDASIYTPVASLTAFDAGRLHDVRSISKSVLALLWGIAEGEGRMPPLATPVLDLLPELAGLKNGGRERITLLDLLTMRSGLDWNEGGSYGLFGNDEIGLMWRSEQARFLFDRPLAAAPGARFNYDGGHVAVLARLLAERTGMPLAEYARVKLFEPLGITDWAWLNDLRGRPLSYSGLRLRPRDVARIGRMVLAGGAWNGRQVVPAAWLQASFIPHPPHDPQAPGLGYGYLWWMGELRIDGRSHAWRAGFGNGGQRLFMLPDLDLVVVMTAGDYNQDSIGREVAGVLRQVVGAIRQGQ
jgi:CubicO group peptidase (beta-lactamase class C family)